MASGSNGLATGQGTNVTFVVPNQHRAALLVCPSTRGHREELDAIEFNVDT